MLVARLSGDEKGAEPRDQPHRAISQADLIEALERLVQLYDARNKPDEAAKWRKELEAQRKAAEQPVKPKDK